MGTYYSLSKVFLVKLDAVGPLGIVGIVAGFASILM